MASILNQALGMNTTLRATLAQINPCVGDLEGNTELILSTVRECQAHTDLIVFPELCLTAYPPEDLLLRRDFIRETERQLERIADATRDDDAMLIVGHPFRDEGGLYNAASVLHRGRVVAVYKKRFLPNYNVFDEKRYFSAGSELLVFKLGELRIGLVICEDIWEKQPVSETVEMGRRGSL